MKYIKHNIQLICKAISKMRSGGRCEMCGETKDAHQHHLFFGPRRTDWRTFTNPDFYASLCSEHHLYLPESPHVDNDTFLAIFLPKIEESRCEAIMDFKDNYTKPPFLSKEGWKKLHADLKQQYEDLKNICWMDSDIEPEFGRTNTKTSYLTNVSGDLNGGSING